MEADDQIRKGFNAGYLMEKLNPELAQKIRQGITNGDNPYLLGFSKGAEQYNQESFFETPTLLSQDQDGLDVENSVDLDEEKNIDDIDKGIEM